MEKPILRKFIVAVIVSLSLLSATATPVFAVTSNPDMAKEVADENAQNGYYGDSYKSPIISGTTYVAPASNMSNMNSSNGYTGNEFSYNQNGESITTVPQYDDGSIGYIYIPSIDKSVKVYAGDDDMGCMRHGAWNFTNTSQWDGNVALAGHNRGSSGYFEFVKNLNVGDEIDYTTQEGTRRYQVYRHEQVSVNDTSCLNYSTSNILTLSTCVENKPDLRWCVQALQIE